MFREHTGPDPKPEKKPKPKKRIKPVSEKRRHELAVYAKLRPVFLEENPVCKVCNKAKAVQIHHKSGRAGRLLTTWNTFLAVCHSCHDRIHREPVWAFENNFIEYRNK